MRRSECRRHIPIIPDSYLRELADIGITTREIVYPMARWVASLAVSNSVEISMPIYRPESTFSATKAASSGVKETLSKTRFGMAGVSRNRSTCTSLSCKSVS